MIADLPNYSTPVIAYSFNQEIQIQVTNDGILLRDLRVNGETPATSGANAGWVVTYNAANTVSFTYSALAGSTITLTDQRGNVLGSWDIAADIENAVISDNFTLPDGIGNYYLTLLLTVPTVSGDETRELMIPVKYLALDGGDICDQDPVPPECLPPIPPDTGTPEPPKVPDTGGRYMYLFGYAMPTKWVVFTMLFIVGASAGYVFWKKAKLDVALRQSVRFEEKGYKNANRDKKAKK